MTEHEDAQRVGKALAWLIEGLNEEERVHLGVEILDAARKDPSTLEYALSCWVATSVMRRHPDFAFQTKEYHNLMSSGELFQGVSFFEGMDPSELKAAAG